VPFEQVCPAEQHWLPHGMLQPPPSLPPLAPQADELSTWLLQPLLRCSHEFESGHQRQNGSVAQDEQSECVPQMPEEQEAEAAAIIARARRIGFT
jgi:hypothetical protein